MKIFLDPGHGMGNVSEGKYDPGAVIQPSGVEEADIALQWALTGKALLMLAGHEVVLSRKSEWTEAPLNKRVKAAEEAGCEMYISLHMNAASDGSANGSEVFYKDPDDRTVAFCALHSLVALGFRSRGVKTEDQSARKKLHVLTFNGGPVILIEIGFLTNMKDLLKAQARENRIKFWEGFIRECEKFGKIK